MALSSWEKEDDHLRSNKSSDLLWDLRHKNFESLQGTGHTLIPTVRENLALINLFLIFASEKSAWTNSSSLTQLTGNLAARNKTLGSPKEGVDVNLHNESSAHQ